MAGKPLASRLTAITARTSRCLRKRRQDFALAVQLGGALTGLLLYLLVQMQMLSATSITYVTIILVISVLIGITAWLRGEVGWVTIQLVWTTVSVVKLFMTFK